MKNIFLTAALCLIAFMGIADTNPFINNGGISSTPIPGPSPKVELSFIFGNSGTDPIAASTVLDGSDPIIIKVSLANGYVDDAYAMDPSTAVSGVGAFYFTWTYDIPTRTFTGTQITTIPGRNAADPLNPTGIVGPIVIKYRAQVATTIAQPNNGFSANLTSNGNAPNGPGTNNINDDYVMSKSYVEGVLPVTLSKFDVQKEGSIAQLSWITTQESKSSYFQVEHSNNAKNWNSVGKVLASQNSSAEIPYSFTHHTPSNGLNYYRLKMVDLDDTFAYSVTKTISMDVELVLFPNPVSDKIYLKGISAESFKAASILTVAGQQVASAQALPANGIDVKHLPEGIYLVQIAKIDGTLSTHKIVIRK